MQFIEFPKIDFKIEGMEDVKIPKMFRIRQRYDKTRIIDIASHIRRRMEENLSDREQFKGRKLCITAGSRGIPNLDVIIKTIVDILKEWGAEPFIIPAMGSHGGATAEGQLEILATCNITEESMGVPIKSSMDVVQIGNLPDGTPLFCDKYAAGSDGIILLNKVKPHTDFRAKHESGLAKMLAIGIAKHAGASQFHMKGVSTFAERIPQVCRVFLDKLPVAFGVGIVQNAYDKISRIEIMEKDRILVKDAELQRVAKASVANFKFRDIDVLIIDEIGKNISGNGADPNVTGRSMAPGFEGMLNLKKLFIRGLNKETHHNACGISLADVTTRRCLNSVDFESTWINVVTSTMLAGGKIPMYRETDRDAVMLAIRTCNDIDFNNPRVVRIKDTLSMEYIEVSEAYLDECAAHPEIEIVSEPHKLEFDADGFMTDVF
ncbi:MAG: nickel-dependent lactate racemase [Acidobacteriota bacterium]|nr:nickel-dependent lactate racemase [Acidobacteriota bacterium]